MNQENNAMLQDYFCHCEIKNPHTWQCDGDKCSSMLIDCKLSEQGTSFEQSNRFIIVLVFTSQW